jgi:nicotinate phosphoribosyltransferase
MEPIIKSFLDTDFYKISMGQAVLQLYPTAHVVYKFINRDTSMKFNQASYDSIVENIKAMASLALTEDEFNFLKKYSFLNIGYLEYLKNYRFKPEQVHTSLSEDGLLNIKIEGPWHETILWEVCLMAIVSESYFNHVDVEWKKDIYWQIEQITQAQEKAMMLSGMKGKFTDFGTRRRRNYETQDLVVKTFSDMHKEGNLKNFFGTSNVHLAHKYGLRAIGSCAHEWFCGISALESLRHANRFALEKWQEVYKGSLGYALTDTFGTDTFLKDFTPRLAREFDAVRQDSGDPFMFTDKMIKHYESCGVDPTTKLILFSDGLTVNKCLKLDEYCSGNIRCSFGVGTHFSNDFKCSKPLNIVIKLYSVNDIPVVKLSDSHTKATGDKDALKVAMWTFFNRPL